MKRKPKPLPKEAPKQSNPVDEGWEILKRAASRSPRLTDPEPGELLAEMQDLISEKDW